MALRARVAVLFFLLGVAPLGCTDAPTPAPRDAGVGRDAAPDLDVAPDLDAALPDVGDPAPADAGGTGGDAPIDPPDAVATADAPTTGIDCAAFSGVHEVCGATPTACNLVFRDGSGCAAACAAGGMTCVESYRDHDDVTPALCEPHPTTEAYACAETGHASDYCVCAPATAPAVAFPGAEGFGAYAEGGRGGTVYTVTNLNDRGTGSLRWAVERTGRRIVEFAVDGVIRLESALDISDPYITIDGRGALDPGEAGITLRDYPIDIRTHDVVIRYLRVRLGDSAVLRRVRDAGLSRPANSDDLDCINIDQSSQVILDHISASWSTDEIVSITNSRNVTVQWSILSEPIANPMAHPYGNNHAFCANNSAATLTYHHNLFAHYVFRGPQFEANDMNRSSPVFDAMFEAVNNVVYGFESNGSRYRTGFERASDRIGSVDFLYHFVANRYINADSGRSEIVADTSFGTETNIRVYVRNNIGPHRGSGADDLALVFTDTGAGSPVRSSAAALRQVSPDPLFVSTVPVTTTSADVARDAVFADAGCSIERDAIDTRVIDDARARRPTRVIMSQADVPGGWPTF